MVFIVCLVPRKGEGEESWCEFEVNQDDSVSVEHERGRFLITVVEPLRGEAPAGVPLDFIRFYTTKEVGGTTKDFSVALTTVIEGMRLVEAGEANFLDKFPGGNEE